MASNKPKMTKSERKRIRGGIRAQVESLGPMPKATDLSGLPGTTVVRHGDDAALRVAMSPRPPAGYWSNFDNVRAETVSIVKALGRLPTAAELSDQTRAVLKTAMDKHHGGVEISLRRIAQTLDPDHKPPGYWNDMENVRKAFDGIK